QRQEVKRSLPPAVRAEIFQAAVDLLPLRPEALADLLRRGLTFEQAWDAGYRSIPRESELPQFLKALVDQFGEAVLRSCPGFEEERGHLTFWKATAQLDGYIVP